MSLGTRVLGSIFVSLIVTLPIALSRSTSDTDEGLVVVPVRADVVDATKKAVAVVATGTSDADARLAIDGREETSWVGHPGESEWMWSVKFDKSEHVGAIRAHLGHSPTMGVPTAFRWEARTPESGGCGDGEDRWTPIESAIQSPSLNQLTGAQPTHRTWFIDAEVCALRLVVQRTNGGPPVLREVTVVESASDVLRGAASSDDGSFPGFDPEGAIDGTYARRWAGAPGKTSWTLRIDLRDPIEVDRIRLVLGFDATSAPRADHGRQYRMAWGPVHYSLQVSEDGNQFSTVAFEPQRADGSPIPLRRRLVLLGPGHVMRSIRLVIHGATDGGGIESADAVPVVREISAYRADDPRPVMPQPWILSVNSNPTGQLRSELNGEVANDAFYAKFLQRRFGLLMPDLRSDDRYARSLDDQGAWHDAAPSDHAGQVLESIEGDDPELDTRFLAESSPPPIAALSGSNDWDYSDTTGPDPEHPKRWLWDPVRDALSGGMGNLGAAVRHRLAPFLGFCGGAQILGLLESIPDGVDGRNDRRHIDSILRRAAGRPIRGFASMDDVARAWPDDPHPTHAKVEFASEEPLFADVWSVHRCATTLELPESHADALRPDAFLPRGPLRRFEVLARSLFCGMNVSSGGPSDRAFPNPDGPGSCVIVPEAFRSKDQAWPIVATQFHVEQHDFTTAGPGDPPESIADPRLFLAATFEVLADSYLKFGH